MFLDDIPEMFIDLIDSRSLYVRILKPLNNITKQHLMDVLIMGACDDLFGDCLRGVDSAENDG